MAWLVVCLRLSSPGNGYFKMHRIMAAENITLLPVWRSMLLCNGPLQPNSTKVKRLHLPPLVVRFAVAACGRASIDRHVHVVHVQGLRGAAVHGARLVVQARAARPRAEVAAAGVGVVALHLGQQDAVLLQTSSSRITLNQLQGRQQRLQVPHTRACMAGM